MKVFENRLLKKIYRGSKYGAGEHSILFPNIVRMRK
jgi:hypothetical protein